MINIRLKRLSYLTAPILIALIGIILWIMMAAQSQPVYAFPGKQSDNLLSETITSTITGTVSYTGLITGTHLVWVGAFTTTFGVPPVYVFMRENPGPYTLTISEAGSYYIMGGLDVDNQGGPPDPEVDPTGSYVGNPITVTADQTITGIDFVLIDPFTPPVDTGSISGWISYNGAITQTHNIIVYASKVGSIGPPSYFTIIPSAGAYSITGMEQYTYTVAAFMDIGDDMGPPGPADPFGFYDPLGFGYPQELWVPSDPMVNGIDIVLADPYCFVYLAVVVR